MNNIFRKSALERLSSPEQLDKTIVVTSPMSWLAILGVALIIVTFIIWAFIGTLPTTENATGIFINGYDTMIIRSTNSGELVESNLIMGDVVTKGKIMGTLKTHGGEEIDIQATQSGIITDICMEPGDFIEKYDAVAKISPDTKNGNVIVAFLPVGTGKAIQVGMSAIVNPLSVDTQKYGHMEATVIGVDDYITSKDEIKSIIGNNDSLSEYISSNMPLTAIVLSLVTDEASDNGYYWTNKNGKRLSINDGTLMDIKLIVNESSPISKLLPIFNTEAE